MKSILVLSIIVACALAAPTDETSKFKAAEEWETPDIHRLKKSAYGAQSSYGGSSGLSGTVLSGLSAPISSAPCGSSGPLPLALYLSPQVPSAGFSAVPQSGSHYREDEHSGEHKARSYYDSSALSGLSGLSAPVAARPSSAMSFSPEASSSSAVGVFPNAKVGGCAVPILLSCSPNVVSGHLAQPAPAHASSYSAPSSFSAPSYRMHEQMAEHELKREMRNTADWKVVGKSASHFQVSKDYPEEHPGNHHVISKDYPEPNLVKISTPAPAQN